MPIGIDTDLVCTCAPVYNHEGYAGRARNVDCILHGRCVMHDDCREQRDNDYALGRACFRERLDPFARAVRPR